MKNLLLFGIFLLALPLCAQAPPPPSIYGNGMQAFAQGLSNWRIGFDVQAQSNRFIAETTGGAASVRVFIKTGSGYSAGNGGTTTISIQTDDGTSNHFPSGTVLVSKSIAINSEVPGELFTFASNPTLTAGTIYHAVWTNTGGSPTVNYISSDGFFNDGTAAPYYSLTAWGQLNEHGTTWSTAYNTEPIMAVCYTSGYCQGMGYVDSQPTTSLTGSTQSGESFVVSGGSKVVNAIHVHMGMTGTPAAALTVTVKQGATTVFTGTIPSSSFSTSAQKWGSATISPNLTLASGTAYTLQLSCATCTSGNTYFTDPMNKGTGNGYQVASTFPDGNYQVNGSGTSNQDAQFYFSTLSGTPYVNLYLAQSAAGTMDGSGCGNAIAVSFFNTSSNWGNGTNQIAPGTTVHLCGSITTALTFQTGGLSGSPVTLIFESGALMTSAAWNTTAISGGGFSWLVLDFGSNGIIQNTANGTTGTFANSLASIAVDFSGSSNSIIRAEGAGASGNISNIYVRTANSTTDNSAGAQGNRCILWGGGSNNLISGVTTHDCRFNYYPSGAADSNITISNMVMYHQSGGWWIAPGNTGSTLTNVVWKNNQFHDPAPAWDSGASDYFHNEAFHYFCQGSSTCSGLTVANNYIYGAFGLDYTAGIFTETNGGTNAAQQIYNNVLAMPTTTQSSNGAIDVQMGASGLLANNTVVGSGSANGGTGINIISGSQLTQKNNLVQGFQYMESTSAGVTFAPGGLNTNLYYDFTSGWQWQGTGESTFAAWQSASGQDGNSISGSNPNLAANFQPNLGSPAITAGTNLLGFGIIPLDTDFLGVARPSQNGIQSASTNWSLCFLPSCNPGGSGTPTSFTQTYGTNSVISLSGPAFSNGLAIYKLAGTNSATSFGSDFLTTISTTNIQAAEFDMFKFASGTEWMFGTQCNFATGLWQVWNQSGGVWVNTSLACSLTAGVQHHIQEADHVCGSNMCYDSITIDGVRTPWALSEPSSSTAFADAIGIQFQLDENSSGTSVSETLQSVDFGFTPWDIGAIQAALGPAVSLSPSSLSFGSILVGNTSATQTDTLTNTGAAPLTTASAITLTTGTQFLIPGGTNTCPSSLGAGNSCTVGVACKPTTAGAKSDSLVFTNNAANSPQSVALTCTGVTPPAVSFSAATSACGSSAVGTPVACPMITLTNTGGSNLVISGLATSAPFTLASSGCTTIAAAGTCTITPTFTPTSATFQTGTVSVTDNASGSPHTFAVNGTGTGSPVVSTPTDLFIFVVE